MAKSKSAPAKAVSTIVDKKGVIKKVELNTGQVLSKSKLVKELDNGAQIAVGSGKKEALLEAVHPKDGKAYAHTHRDSTTADNLGSLPKKVEGEK